MCVLLGLTVLIFDIVASFTKLSIRTPNRNTQAGSKAPVIIAISVPVMMSRMSQPSAYLNYSYVKECEKTQEITEEIIIGGECLWLTQSTLALLMWRRPETVVCVGECGNKRAYFFFFISKSLLVSL